MSRQDGTDIPDRENDEGSTDNPKSTPSSSRPPSSLSVSTAPSNSTTPTPPNMPKTAQLETADHPTESGVIKSPCEDETVRAIAKPPKKRKTMDDMEQEVVSTTIPSKQPAVNLDDWINQRVLARKDNTYQPGLIKEIFQRRDVGVLFDGDKDKVFFHDVLDSNKLCDLINDNPPSAMMISVGCRVCVRIKSEQNIFYEGQVIDKKMQQYRVRLAHALHVERFGPEVHIARAAVRLMQPPWYEDLQEGIPEQPTPPPPPHISLQQQAQQYHQMQVCKINLYHHLGYFSYFSQKIGLTFLTNCLLRRQFA